MLVEIADIVSSASPIGVLRKKPPIAVGGFLYFFLHNVRIEKTMNTMSVANPIIIEIDSNTVIGITSHPVRSGKPTIDYLWNDYSIKDSKNQSGLLSFLIYKN